jgi:hypothetical protein
MKLTRADVLHVLDFFEEIEAVIDTDDGSVIDKNVLDKFLSSKQIVEELKDEVTHRNGTCTCTPRLADTV